MKKLIVVLALTLLPMKSRADMWGADLPLLAEIVFNTLHTMFELQQQTSYMADEMDGIKDRIDRVQTIANLVHPATWDRWRDPKEAAKRLSQIYRVMPKEYRNEKYNELDSEISNALNMTAQVRSGTESAFRSGKELERRGADASPGVAQKLTASGIGSLVSVQSQSLALQSHIVTMLAQMMAQANETETRGVVSKGNALKTVSAQLESKFSSLALKARSF